MLLALRPVTRRGGEDSSFIQIAFHGLVKKQVEIIKKQRDYDFIYTRSLKYRPMLEQVLADHNLPEIFSLIPWIESGFSPSFTDASTGRAGIWGLTREVAERHGLKVGQPRDERLDVALSTRAACSYLTELVGELRGQSFLLSLSAYRAGPLGARKMLLQKARCKVEEFSLWAFYRNDEIPRPLRDYLVRVLAAATVSEAPEMFQLPPREP